MKFEEKRVHQASLHAKPENSEFAWSKKNR